jgi:hypothetical protein
MNPTAVATACTTEDRIEAQPAALVRDARERLNHVDARRGQDGGRAGEEHVRAQAGGLVGVLAVGPDDPSERHRERDAAELAEVSEPVHPRPVH